MHDPVVKARVLELAREGWSDVSISNALALPRGTVRYMRASCARTVPRCPRCWRPARATRFTPGEYAELLGLYLGDGHIVRAGRTLRLRLFLDAHYPVLADEARQLLERCLPGNRVSITRLQQRSTLVVSVYSVHLACVFPQHGPGVKHQRPIELEDWQRALVDAAPWSFIRGMILSDGCAFINRTGRYRYLSYEFRNQSADIRALFAAACEQVGVDYTCSRDRIRICRRASVGEMAAFVGTKR